MNILVHGDVIRFDCHVCGCKFDAGRKEIKDKDEYTCICPDCGCIVRDGIRLLTEETLATIRGETKG